MGEIGASHTTGNVNGCKRVWQFLKKLNRELPLDLIHSTARCVFRRSENICSRKNLHMDVPTTLLLTAKTQKHRKMSICGSTDNVVSAYDGRHRMVWCSVIQRNGVVTHGATKMDLKTLCQVKEGRHERQHLTEFMYANCLEQANLGTESSLVVARCCGEGDGE